jgi:hypothetical protein
MAVSPVFDGNVKVRTRVRLDRDRFQPKMGTLGSGSATEEALVHGRRVERIEGTLKLTVNQLAEISYRSDARVRVGGNYVFTGVGTGQITFIGDKTETLMSNSTLTIFGVETKTQFGGYNGVDVSVWSLMSQGFKNLLNPSSWMEIKTNAGVLVTSMNVTMGAINLQGFVQNTEAYAQQINVLGHDTLIKGIDTEAKMLKQRLAGMVNAIDGLEGSVQALKAQAGAVEGKVKPCEAGIIKLATQSVMA